MSTTYEKVTDQLEEILEKNVDAEKGYKKAAENATDLNLKNFFERKAKDRGKFNAELRRELSSNYEEIDEDGSFAGTVHRSWMDVKAFFSGDNDEAMLEEAIKGDKAAVEEYEEVLEDSTLPQSLATLVRNQLISIRTDLNNVRRLEDLK
ncbi:ferritin-like domain-containing protein [Maribacter sp. 2-571]|uniref:ferritin-like domain-containing protein n=1 Tax=Maribacter sp. 2-571 TaxID=3417569 RepID=UPI003D3443F6